VKRRLKWILIALVAAFALLQLTNIGRSKPTVTPGHDLFSTNPPPAHIAAMLRDACYDCHSYETHWPWYGHVAPVSWWINSHISDAREVLNFSEWPHTNAEKAARKWNHISDSVREGDMPLPSYMKVHTVARLTDAQRNTLADWAEQESARLKAAATNAP
jgi:hypothetical protein